jgi:hypothetical protein
MRLEVGEQVKRIQRNLFGAVEEEVLTVRSGKTRV